MTLYDFGVGGYDLEFYCESLDDGDSIIVSSNIAVTLADAEIPSEAVNYIVIERDQDEYYAIVKDKNETEIDRYVFELEGECLGLIRVVFHNEFCTVYVHDTWLHTFSFIYVYHPEEIDVYLSCNPDTIEITDVRLKELADWREAIFIDLETTGQNAIGSVILQRPLEIFPSSDGKLRFFYNVERDEVEVDFVHKYFRGESDNQASSSDAIVYFTRTGIVNDRICAQETGFITRLIRLPDLDNGAIPAAKKIQQMAREDGSKRRLSARLDARIEPGDIVTINKVANTTLVDDSIVVESIGITVSDRDSSMEISGRKYLG